MYMCICDYLLGFYVVPTTGVGMGDTRITREKTSCYDSQWRFENNAGKVLGVSFLGGKYRVQARVHNPAVWVSRAGLAWLGLRVSCSGPSAEYVWRNVELSKCMAGGILPSAELWHAFNPRMPASPSPLFPSSKRGYVSIDRWFSQTAPTESLAGGIVITSTCGF